MRILVLYGTSEGQTHKIARFLGEQLTRHGHEVTLVDAQRQQPSLREAGYDAAIVAARVHAGRYQRQIVHFVRDNRDMLDGMPNAFLSVSMSAADQRPGDMERAKGYVDAFVRGTGWTPRQVLQVAGARLYTHHSAFGRWIFGIVDRHQFDTSRDHEWTDWPSLERFAAAFAAAQVAAAPPARVASGG